MGTVATIWSRTRTHCTDPSRMRRPWSSGTGRDRSAFCPEFSGGPSVADLGRSTPWPASSESEPAFTVGRTEGAARALEPFPCADSLPRVSPEPASPVAAGGGELDPVRVDVSSCESSTPDGFATAGCALEAGGRDSGEESRAAALRVAVGAVDTVGGAPEESGAAGVGEGPTGRTWADGGAPVFPASVTR